MVAECRAGIELAGFGARSPRGAHDLIIAAHAVQTGRIVVSRDLKARFEGLSGVVAVEP